MADLLVNLYRLPHRDLHSVLEKRGISIKRVLPPDKSKVLSFIRENFQDGWADECEHALFHDPVGCYIAVKEHGIIGFACYDATARGFFGPTGVQENERRQGIGAALLHACLHSMKELGYGYAVIGWPAKEAIPFYQREAGAVLIENSEPDESIYSNLIDI